MKIDRQTTLDVIAGACIGALVVLFLWHLLGCYPPPPPPEPTPQDQNSCEAACANLKRLGCPGHDGSPGPDRVHGTADDVPCAEVCAELVAVDESVALHQGCVARAPTCDAAERCFDE